MDKLFQFITEEPTILAIPFYLITMLVENIILWRQNRPYEIPDAAASISGGLGSLIVRFFWNIPFIFLLDYCYDTGLHLMDNVKYTWILLLFLDDFTYYWYHRFSHQIRFLWGTHIVHHSSQRYHLATALRQSWTAPIVETPFWLPIAFLGFAPHMILIQMSLNLIYQYWIHTEAIRSLGPLEYILNTPSHHRVHHGSNLQYLDRNYGGIFIIWDRIFGTFKAEIESVKYGLTKNINTFNWFAIQFHELYNMLYDIQCARSLKDKFRKTFASPSALSRDEVRQYAEGSQKLNSSS